VTQVGEDGTSIVIDTELHNVKANFDRVFDHDTSQDELYEQVKNAISSVLEGYNSTIFAYGQTGSGKSFTMYGPEDDLGIYASQNPSKMMGIIPRAIRNIMANVSCGENADGEEIEVSIFCSFLQIYNDQAFDLLRDPERSEPLEVHENTDTQEIYVLGLSEYCVQSTEECLALLEQGDEQRACRQTQMNDVSSRSHSIFQVVLERRNLNSGHLVRSKMNLVDLAGSEKWGYMGRLEQGHIAELTNINSSLHTLGRCIAALTNPKATHIPFRDSKLTRILQDALGGNSRTYVIATLSPAASFVEESVSTLKFADRAKKVMQHARVVENREISAALVESLEKEIARLKSILNEAGIPFADRSLRHLNQSSSSSEGKQPVREAARKPRKTSLPASDTQSQEKIETSIQENNDESQARLKTENRHMLQTIAALRECANRFFSFEVEEDEFQEEFRKQLQAVPNLPAPARKKALARAAFRVQGAKPTKKGEKQVVIDVSKDTPKTLTSSLREKQKELEKHMKMQEFISSKAQTELSRLEEERRRDEEQAPIQPRKPTLFRKKTNKIADAPQQKSSNNHQTG